MIPYTQESADRPTSGVGAFVVGEDFRVFDGALDESQTLACGDLVVFDTDAEYWRKSTLEQMDAPAWEAEADQELGAIIQPSTPNGHAYEVTTAGQACPTTEPTWPTNGSTVADDDDATAWAADTVTAVGKIVKPTTPNGHLYECTARADDYKTHATDEPTWPTDGSEVVDDAVTWTDRGPIAVYTDLGAFDTTEAHFGVMTEAATSGADEHPIVPIFRSGAVLRSALKSFPPTSVPVGAVLGGLWIC